MPRAGARGGGGGAFHSLGGRERSHVMTPGRRVGRTDLDEEDLYEWIIVFGDSKADVQAMRRLRDDENPYLVLQDAFERVRAPGAPSERVLRTDLKTAASGKHVYLRVGAYDDEGLMSEAQDVGFLKRVIELEDSMAELGTSRRGRKAHPSDEGWTTNCDQAWGRILGYAPFTKGQDNEHVKWFEDPTHMTGTDEADFYPSERFFNSGERQRLVKSLMNSVLWQNKVSKFGQECKYGPEYEYVFSTAMAGGPEARKMPETEHPPGGPAEKFGNQKLYLEDIYPLHCESERSWLEEKWTSTGYMFAELPLDPIRRYFGTTVGLYFAWLELYTRYLRAPAVFGLVIFIVESVTGAVSLNEMGNWLIAYSIFIALWSTMFLEMWKRRESELKHDWGTAQAVRHSQDIDIHDDVRPASVEQRRELEERGGAPKLQLVAASFGTLLALCVALCLVAGIPLWIKALGAYVSAQACTDPGTLDDDLDAAAEDAGGAVPTLQELDHSCAEIPSLATWLSYGGSFINLLCIVLLQPICERVVRELTEHEQHRTYTEHAGSMVIKGFTLQFVIHYFVLFYVAFFKDGEFLGTPDTCSTVNEDVVDGGVAAVPDCINDLATQIFVVFVVKTVLQQVWEMGAPRIRRWWRQLQQGASVDDEEGTGVGYDHLERFEDQHLWDSPEYEGGTTYKNFEEMCIQFGFVAIFAVAYPLGAAFALLNNLLEIRLDGYVLLTMMRRPRYSDSESIGSWMSVLQCISVVAVVTNSMMVGFTSTVLVHDMDLLEHISSRYLDAGLWVCVMAMEHILLLAKVLLMIFIPDESQDTLIKKAALDKFMLRRKHESASDWDMPSRLSPVPALEASSRWSAVP